MDKKPLIIGGVAVALVAGIALVQTATDKPAPAPRAAVSIPTTTPVWTPSTPTTTITTTTRTSSAAASTTVSGRAETKALCTQVLAAVNRRSPATDALNDHVRAEGWTWNSVKPIASAAASALDGESTTVIDLARRSGAPSEVTSAARDYGDAVGDWAESIRGDLAARSTEGFTRTNALKPHVRELAQELDNQCKT
ncbi:hypothetical protein TSST111916_18945 [Tsukamurella strandjordii]|uniref:hypothetical protein n=1 Tax=Tsukamurella TaxID=2060 RepID=UPI001C7CF54A|nr:hypothetical protein [Tsukamurella sp. TY48]GIZ97539.1 hypothetical protein TTY48_21510 [Tsukamurella sp. TY48]